MADRNLVERYVRKFRKELESYLVNGVSVRLDILYAKDGGGLVKVTFNQKVKILTTIMVHSIRWVTLLQQVDRKLLVVI